MLVVVDGCSFGCSGCAGSFGRKFDPIESRLDGLVDRSGMIDSIQLIHSIRLDSFIFFRLLVSTTTIRSSHHSIAASDDALYVYYY